MRICVLTGGTGEERGVAFASGEGIANALIRRGHRVALWDLCADVPEGEELFRWVPYAPYHVGDPIPARGERILGEGIRRLVSRADVVVPALHGGVGEDGTLQMLLDAWNICYTGSNGEACRITMDKEKTKRLLRQEGIPTAEWVLYRRGEALSAEPWERSLGYPMVVKPCRGGSSVGVSVVRDRAALIQGVEQAAAYDPLVLIERFVCGRELSVGVLDGRILPPVEILPQTGFYDFEGKYLAQSTRLCCPAEIGEVATERVCQAARRTFALLGMRGYGRIDFLLTDGGLPVCLEANALPGMTEHSLLPLAAKTVGISYDALCEQLVQTAWSGWHGRDL